MTRFIWGNNNIISRKWQSHYETTQSPCVCTKSHYEGTEVIVRVHDVIVKQSGIVSSAYSHSEGIQVIQRLHNVIVPQRVIVRLSQSHCGDTQSHCEGHTEALWKHSNYGGT